jgi:hypothetical protein
MRKLLLLWQISMSFHRNDNFHPLGEFADTYTTIIHCHLTRLWFTTNSIILKYQHKAMLYFLHIFHRKCRLSLVFLSLSLSHSFKNLWRIIFFICWLRDNVEIWTRKKEISIHFNPWSCKCNFNNILKYNTQNLCYINHVKS